MGESPGPSVPLQTAIRRLTMDYKSLIADPLPSVIAHPAPDNLFQWHYLIYGSPGSLYEGGYYHGQIDFPPTFPFSPPSIKMFTPSGRFETDTKLCLSITDYHPEKWNPSWTVSSILMGFVSFMNDNEYNHAGGIKTTDKEKEKFAKESRDFNLRNPKFREIFEELIPLLEMDDDEDFPLSDDGDDPLSDGDSK
uniref:UBC core domain-containing protein n=1 Tax=Panagrolaimus sp. ES5 TaxID=591445 RepID=A0AC34FBD1_9BILA